MKKISEWCMYCGECAGVCPRSLIEVHETNLIFSEENCKDCELCIQVCPVHALTKEE